MKIKIKIILLFIITLLVTSCATTNNMSMQTESEISSKNVRVPAVAGQFYPGDEAELRQAVGNYLETGPAADSRENVRAIMVPHAGYEYSGAVAGKSYSTLRDKKVDTIVIISNSHAEYFQGVAIDDSDLWQTPLGEVSVDKKLAKKLVNHDEDISFNSIVHASDHTLEAQLPFLQIVLKGDFKIVPILFGNTGDGAYLRLAEALAENLGENDLIVISTDLSHYPGYKDANEIDQETLRFISTKDISQLDKHIKNTEAMNVKNEQTLCCGSDGVRTIMELAKTKGWKAEILGYANSGDSIIGDKERVVGYGAMVFSGVDNAQGEVAGSYRSVPLRSTSLQDDISTSLNAGSGILEGDLNQEQKEKLLNIARTTVETYVRDGRIPEFEIEDERLKRKEGAFVTLKTSGELRGCIGQIVPSEKPLWQVVQDMAIAAATEDHRFSVVSKNELTELDYEVSVLSQPEDINDWQEIELGKHGVIVRKGFQSGVFLPQVAEETGWSREEFLGELCAQKAGLSPDAYKNDPEAQLSVFTAQVFGEG